MLKSLFIQNYALIDTLDIRFEPGFSVITGETGAGKSIILGAIGLHLGQRADSKAIKNGAAKCVIEAFFDLSAYGMEEFFSRNDLEFDGHECILRREITAAGKSRAFINDTPASVAQLKALGGMLIDIHSQHQNLLLNQEDFQLNVIDILAGDKEELRQYGTLFADYKQAEKALAEKKEDRFETAGKLRQALEELLSETAETKRAGKKGKHRALQAAKAVCAAAVCLLAAVLLLSWAPPRGAASAGKTEAGAGKRAAAVWKESVWELIRKEEEGKFLGLWHDLGEAFRGAAGQRGNLSKEADGSEGKDAGF